MSDEQTPRPRGPYSMQYARIAVPDMQDTIEFLTYHVGLQLEQHDESHAYLRADIGHHNIELLHEPHRTESETVAVGYTVESSATLADLRRRVGAAGYEIVELDEKMQKLCAEGFGVVDPNGLIVELFTEFTEYAEPPLLEYRPIELVHPFLATPKYDETLEFYRDVLGFMASDYIEDVTAFLRCENRYHHTVAIQKNKEYYVAHLCFMMKSFDHVMRGRAKAQYKNVPIASDLVNHSASTSIAFYMHDVRHGPRYELCDLHRVFTPEEHETHRARRMSLDPRNIDVWRPAADDWGRF